MGSLHVYKCGLRWDPMARVCFIWIVYITRKNRVGIKDKAKIRFPRFFFSRP